MKMKLLGMYLHPTYFHINKMQPAPDHSAFIRAGCHGWCMKKLLCLFFLCVLCVAVLFHTDVFSSNTSVLYSMFDIM